MARRSRREKNELAADYETCAARCARNAKSGREAAADPTLSANTRRQAEASAKLADKHEQEYREDAATLREGRIPGEDW